MVEKLIDTDRIVSEVMPQIHERLVARVVESLVEDVYDVAARDKLSEELSPFVEKEVMPALKATLAEATQGIVEGLVAEVVKIGPVLAERLAAAAGKALAERYTAEKIFGMLFGGRY